MGRPVNFSKIPTEKQNARSSGLDQMSALALVTLMNREDRQVLRAIGQERKSIAQAADRIAHALSNGGKLFFVGAGTSGRLGVLEAAECPPTFNTPASLVQGLMAGGRAAVFRSKEGSEDSEVTGASIVRRRVRRGDILVGIAASGVTPFVREALRVGKRLGASTVLLTCNPGAREPVDVRIALATGPEVLTGSTRLKAATACKMALNMMTLASMVQLGKVYDHWMVDLQPKSRKLVARGQRLIAQLGQVSSTQAKRLYAHARGRVKPAIVMARQGCSYPDAVKALNHAGGFLRQVIPS